MGAPFIPNYLSKLKPGDNCLRLFLSLNITAVKQSPTTRPLCWSGKGDHEEVPTVQLHRAGGFTADLLGE